VGNDLDALAGHVAQIDLDGPSGGIGAGRLGVPLGDVGTRNVHGTTGTYLAVDRHQDAENLAPGVDDPPADGDPLAANGLTLGRDVEGAGEPLELTISHDAGRSTPDCVPSKDLPALSPRYQGSA
jgi:hypothetical protein